MSSENHSNNHITIDAIIKWIPFFCFWLQSSFNSSKFILLLQPFQTSNAKHIILKILINPIFLSILNDFFQWFPWSFSRSFIGKANSNNSCQLAGCSDKIHIPLLSESYFQLLHLWTVNHKFQRFVFHFIIITYINQKSKHKAMMHPQLSSQL
mgnify:CR=1 FL=1